MAATRTFATLVAKALVEMNLGDPSSPDLTSTHADTIRRALIDVQRLHRQQPLDFLSYKGSFTPTAAVANYAIDGAILTERPTRIKLVHYEDSDGSLSPRGGMEASPFDEVWELLKQYPTTQTFDEIDKWCVHDDELWLAPWPSGNRVIHHWGFRSAYYSYEWDSGGSSWVYRKNDDVVADIDASTGEKWFDMGGDLLVAGAIAKLYEGPYRDEKGLLSTPWRIREAEELEKHHYEYELQGKGKTLRRWGF